MKNIERDIKSIPERGSWTRLKLGLLQEYLVAFVTATKYKAPERYYIDAFAGPGTNRLRETQEYFDGSPRVALQVEPPFTKCFFVEKSRKRAKELACLREEFPGRANTILILVGDCNELIREILEEIPPGAPCFAFLDPQGTELAWSTVGILANHKRSFSKYKIELFILFPFDFLVRLLPRNPRRLSEKHRQLWNVILGTPEWEESYRKVREGDSIEGLRDSFLRIYRSQLDRIGYEFIKPILITDEKGKPMYFMIFASDHPAGDKIMTSIYEKASATQQLSLLQETTPRASPRER